MPWNVSDVAIDWFGYCVILVYHMRSFRFRMNESVVFAKGLFLQHRRIKQGLWIELMHIMLLNNSLFLGRSLRSS